jgi:very-short-patch-repair endonuclease
VSRWCLDGYLYEIHPRVYAVGHRSRSLDGDLAAAVLYAGPGAMLSHATAAWWLGLTQYRPNLIHVSTPWKRAGRPGLAIHGRRTLERIPHKGIPVTTLPQTLLDYASAYPLDDVRYVLAEAEYHWRPDLDEVRRSAGRGKPGSTVLHRAIDTHWPELARTRSRTERAFLFLCERGGLPRPQVNVHLYGIRVDVYWPEYRLAVELDGGRGHSTERQVNRDHSRDLRLRSKGETVRRYSEPQVLHRGEAVLADVRAAIAQRGAA